MTTTILPAVGSTFSIDGLFTLTIEPRCNSTQRRREWVNTTAGEVEYSECRAHRGGRRAEPMTAEDYPPVAEPCIVCGAPIVNGSGHDAGCMAVAS